MAGPQKIRKTDPCPCGSGKRYRKCCKKLQQSPGPKKALKKAPKPPKTPRGFRYVVDELFQLSNSVVVLIDEGRLDDAEKRCDELKELYPEVMDWMMRRAAVHEARQNWKQAAEHYRMAADFAEKNPGYDQVMIDDFRDLANQLDQKAATGE